MAAVACNALELTVGLSGRLSGSSSDWTEVAANHDKHHPRKSDSYSSSVSLHAATSWPSRRCGAATGQSGLQTRLWLHTTSAGQHANADGCWEVVWDEWMGCKNMWLVWDERSGAHDVELPSARGPSVVGSRPVCCRELTALSRQAPGARTARDGAGEIERPRRRGGIAGGRRGGPVSGRRRRTRAGSAMSSVKARHTKMESGTKSRP
ncbi:hypothetical protein QBC47DRAFT_127237 [Echria macrotheca]|uniref:Uncharacterized protein n=1 Tax=Echria macrotheca TaxID=438768 RepID=A0AAJ0F1G0_9PEZI|nr:hypothetical protein QBC47DRAFT_127237 [Echria macrotheca]